jgi:flagellar basal-body rod protein FlgG
MLGAFFTSATGMRAQEQMIDVAANNLANVNTNGFKRSQLDFADLQYTIRRPAGTEVAVGQPAPIGVEIGSGVRVLGTTKVFTPGVPVETGNATDLAIEGDGFFKVTNASGAERYTRDGAFHPDRDGTLVTGDGYILEGGITIPPDVPLSHVQIGSDGTVSALQADGTLTQIGQIQLYAFQNPAGLSSQGGNLYAVTPASGDPISGTPGLNGFGTLRQSFLELSNVEVVKELVQLITAQRAYEINSRAVRAGDEMLSNISQLIR